jgi:hypothetical protein
MGTRSDEMQAADAGRGLGDGLAPPSAVILTGAEVADHVRRQRGDAVPMLVTTQGAVRVNCATVERDYGDCLLVHVDLHSKRAEKSAILMSGDDDGPSVFLSAGPETLHLDETKPRGRDTIIQFPEHKGWSVFASSGPGRYTLALVLLAPDA